MTQTIIKIPAAGAFDPTDITITDGVDDAFLIKDTGGNEWFKIDTRSGTGSDCINMAYTTGQRVLIGIPASAAQGPYSPLQVTNQNNDSYAVRFYGDTAYSTDNQFTWGRDNQQSIWIHPLGGRFGIASSSGSLDFTATGSRTMFTMDDNTNATFTLDAGNSAVFKVQDDAGTPNEYIKVDTTSGSELNQLKVPFTTGEFKLIQETSAGPYEFIKTTSSSITLFPKNSGSGFSFNGMVINTGGAEIVTTAGQLNMGSSLPVSGAGVRAYVSQTGYSWTELLGTGATSKIQRVSDGLKMLEVDTDSNATFTLDYGSGATFKVVDNNASPRTFINITEGSNTRCAIPTLNFNEIKDASAGRVMQLTTSNGIAVERTPLNYLGSGSLTYDQSNDGTAIDIGKTPSFTVVYSSAASAAATSGITLQVTATDFQDGCVAPQYLVLHNQNATHSAKFILDPIGDFAAKETATTGTDAADLIGSGFTLAAGKMAVFTLLACRVRDTGGHYFYCVSLHTKT